MIEAPPIVVLGPSSAVLIRTPVVVGVPPIPAALIHPDRLLAVARTRLLDTAPESHFDDLVALARTASGAEHGYFTVVDAHRSFWKSAIGVDTRAGLDMRVEDSLCQIVVAADAPLVVTDTRADERTRHLGVVTESGIRSCIDHPVRDGDGQVIGGLCVTSGRPRRWSADEQRAVATLARAISTEVQLRRGSPLSGAQVDALRLDRDQQTALARSLQDSLLPPALPAIPGVDAAAAYLPAGHGVEVVGDFYDLFEAHGQWWVVMGDVVGHGVEAAKLTALARYTIRTEAAHHGATPSDVLTRLHQALIAQHRHAKMITVALATMRPGAHGVSGTLCLAGHEPPLIRRTTGRIDVPSAGGRILGVTDEMALHDTSFTLDRGDVLLLYTDGVTEARAGRGGELFGDERLADALIRCHDLHADSILNRILHVVTEHNHGYNPDDTAIMVIRAG